MQRAVERGVGRLVLEEIPVRPAGAPVGVHLARPLAAAEGDGAPAFFDLMHHLADRLGGVAAVLARLQNDGAIARARRLLRERDDQMCIRDRPVVDRLSEMRDAFERFLKEK